MSHVMGVSLMYIFSSLVPVSETWWISVNGITGAWFIPGSHLKQCDNSLVWSETTCSASACECGLGIGLWAPILNPPGLSILKTPAIGKQEAAISSDGETSKGECPACWDAVGRGPSTPALTQPSWIQPSVTCHRSTGITQQICSGS